MSVATHFWVYFGVLLTCSIALAAMVKPLAEGFAAGGKKPFIYGGISSVLTSMVVYSTNWATDNLFTVYWIMAAAYLAFGIIHLMIVQQKYFYSSDNNSNKIFFGEMIFGLSIVIFTIVVFSTLKHFIKAEDKEFLFYPMMISGIAFFIPMLVSRTFDAAYKIPAAAFKTWQYPMYQEIELPDEDPREKILVIAFEIAKKTGDKNKTFFRAKAPENMKLGELYYHFINDYNDVQSETPIEYAGDDDESNTWWFRVKPRWYRFQRILDPYMSIRENRIKENSVIICERIENS